jgi:hypothetical protein
MKGDCFIQILVAKLINLHLLLKFYFTVIITYVDLHFTCLHILTYIVV